MGFLTRLKEFGQGLADVPMGIAGGIWDLAGIGGAQLLEFDEKERNRKTKKHWKKLGGRTGQISRVFGVPGKESRGLEAIYGRTPIGTGGKAALDAAESAYQHTVNYPLRYAYGWLAQGGLRGENPSSEDVHNLVRGHTLGQMLALTESDVDATDPEAVAAYLETTGAKFKSGGSDFVARMVLDPTIVGGRVTKAAKLKYLVRPIKSEEAARTYVAGKRWNDIQDRVIEPNLGKPEKIRQVFEGDLSGHAATDMAVVMSELPERELRDQVMRAYMGVDEDVQAIAGRKDVLSSKLARLRGEMKPVTAPQDIGFTTADEVQEALLAEVESLVPQERLLVRLDGIRSLGGREPPRTSLPTLAARRLPLGRAIQDRVGESVSLRKAVAGSEWFQKKSLLTAPVQVIYRTRNPVLDLNDVNSDETLANFLLNSRLPAEERNTLRSEYMRASTPEERFAVAQRGESRAVQSILEESGLTADEAIRVTNGGNRIRSLEMRRLEHSRKFANDERARMVLTDPESGHAFEVPLFVSQTRDRMPMVNLGGIETVARRIRNIRRAERVGGERAGKAVKGVYDYGIDLPAETLDRFNYWWKASVLLRLGWPIRVVGEEQFRMFEVLGGILKSEDLINVVLPVPGARKALYNSFEHTVGGNTYSVKGAFDEEIYENLVRSRQNIVRMMEENTRKEMTQFGIPTGGFRSYAPTEPEYGIQWTRAINQQVRNDRFARMVLEGKDAKYIAGRMIGEDYEYARRLPLRLKTKDGFAADEWAQDIVAEVNNLLPTRKLQELALKKNVKFDDLADAIPDAAMRPEVHGEVLAQALGTSAPIKFLDEKIISPAYTWLGSKPTDILSRQPLFAAAYRSEVKRVLNGLPDGVRLSSEELTSITHRARRFALGQTRLWLYDLGKRSDLHGLLRFVSPFAQATQEVITTWVSAAVRDPSLVGKVALLWSSPERLGLTTEYEGETYIVLPQAVSRLILPKNLEDDIGRIRFGKRSLNIALQSPLILSPGPLVTAAASQYARGKPEVEERLKLILPFGASKDFTDAIAPTWLRRARAYGDEDDRSWVSAKASLAIAETVRYRQGLRDKPPTAKEIEEKAKLLFSIRTLAAVVSPTQPIFDSPYWPFIDAYRARFEIDPEGAQEWFLKEYGDELFAVTTSVTKSTVGVPPTMAAYRESKKYEDLIGEYPELGGLIVGDEGRGEFSSSVFKYQMRAPRGPFTEEAQRLNRKVEEFATDPDVRIGWIKYTKLMDLVDAERIKRQLPSLKVKQARDLAAVRRNAVAQIAEHHPAWWDEFRSFDPAKTEHKFEGLYKLAQDDRLLKREAFRGLQKYLKLRDRVIQELESREFSSLDAKANYDLQRLFDAAVGKLVEENLEFGQLYHRYLDTDNLEVRLGAHVPA